MKTGFAASDLVRLARCLRKLLRHADPERLALTGGVGIEVGLAAQGHPGVRTSIQDLDFVAGHQDAVEQSVSTEFLVSHYHVVQPGVKKFLIQLVDPDTRLRVDIFPDLTGSLATARLATIGRQSLKVLSLESIFAHKIKTLSGATEGQPVDPKHDRDARTLGSFLRRDVPSVPSGALVKDVYGGDADAECRRCALSRHPGFPLAPTRHVFAVLGWPTGAAQPAAAHDQMLDGGG